MHLRVSRAWVAFQRALADPVGTQNDLLISLLRRNVDTEFGRAHGFGSISDLRGYRQRVPIARYSDLVPYIDRMLRGEPDVLFLGSPIFFARTSGTTGKPKLIPFSELTQEEYWNYIGPMYGALERDHPGATDGVFSI